jgi:hypothetical protein
MDPRVDLRSEILVWRSDARARMEVSHRKTNDVAVVERDEAQLIWMRLFHEARRFFMHEVGCAGTGGGSWTGRERVVGAQRLGNETDGDVALSDVQIVQMRADKRLWGWFGRFRRTGSKLKQPGHLRAGWKLQSKESLARERRTGVESARVCRERRETKASRGFEHR